MSGVAAHDQSWSLTAERGSVLGIRFIIWLTTALGRGPARLFLRVLAFYYTLFNGRARRGTRAYLEKIQDEPAGFGQIYRQVLRFAHMGLDALYFVSGKIEPFEIHRTGTEHLDALVDRGEGGLLLGAHLGSMYAMRSTGGRTRFPIRPVVYTRHAERVNRLFEALDPDGAARLIQMGEGVSFILKIKEEIDSGAIAVLLADRVGSADRSVEVDFLGKKARFPTGPYILASTLKCPVYLTFALYKDPNVYELFCEPFADRIVLPRKRRQEALEEYVQQYANRLEHYCRKAPDNWFNFYDFWGGVDDG